MRLYDLISEDGNYRIAAGMSRISMGQGTIGSLWIKFEFDHMLSHHEEHEDHEGKTEHMDIPSSCPSW